MTIVFKLYPMIYNYMVGCVNNCGNTIVFFIFKYIFHDAPLGLSSDIKNKELWWLLEWNNVNPRYAP